MMDHVADHGSDLAVPRAGSNLRHFSLGLGVNLHDCNRVIADDSLKLDNDSTRDLDEFN